MACQIAGCRMHHCNDIDIRPKKNHTSQTTIHFQLTAAIKGTLSNNKMSLEMEGTAPIAVLVTVLTCFRMDYSCNAPTGTEL